jgi:site-specific DNA recombinase
MNTNIKFILYARKSTDDLSRQVRSIEDQVAELRDLARRQNLDVIDVIEEKMTAKRPGRPLFNAMLKRIKDGEASGILAWHPDRLARNGHDGWQIMDLIEAGLLQDLKFSTFPFEPTAAGKFLLSIMFCQSKYYIDNLSENIRRGQRQKLKNGIWPMVAPVGYLNDKANKIIVPDPQRSVYVRKAFELYATGTYTLERLAEAVNGLGFISRYGQPFRPTQYHRILQNPLYCGIIRYGGEELEGKHQPIISKKLFDAVQAVISQRSRPTGPKLKPYLYRGLFRCGNCGCFITTETQKGHNYLHCTKRVKRDCPEPYVREEIIAGQITDYIRRLAIPTEWADGMITELEAERNADTHSRENSIQRIRTSIRENDEKLERLMQAYLDKALSLSEYRDAKQQLVREKQDRKDHLTALETRQGSWFEPAIRFVEGLKTSGNLVENGTEEQKRDFLKNVGSNLTISDRHLSVVPREPWKLVVDQGHFAQHTTAPSCDDAAVVGETDHHLKPAERGGFEPPRRFKPSTAFPVLLLQPLGHLSGTGAILFVAPVAVKRADLAAGAGVRFPMAKALARIRELL